jgi:hypothetical protein
MDTGGAVVVPSTTTHWPAFMMGWTAPERHRDVPD